jgi:putative transposase
MEVLQKIERFKSATALDLSQGYYHIPLTKNAQKICTTILPWGKYSYKRLPMGLASAPDIFQSVMTEMFCNLDYVLVYIDDILILQQEDKTENDHLKMITTVLQRLEDKGFRANLRKSFFMQKEIEYLGYLLTDKGLKPQVKKVEAMKRIKPPTNSKQLKRFLGMINFYQDIRKKRSYILAPLSKLSNAKGKKFIWGKEQQNAFVAAKELLESKGNNVIPGL